MKFTSVLKLINFFLLTIALIVGLSGLTVNAQNVAEPAQPEPPSLEPPQEILVPPNSNLDSSSSISNQNQPSSTSSSKSTIPVTPQTPNAPNNPQPVAVSVEDVNPGNTSVRSGGAGLLATIFTLGIIGLGAYMYHKHIRDKSEFKMAEKKIK